MTLRAILLCSLTTTLLHVSGVLAEDPVPIPELKRWEKNMIEFGEKHKDERSFGIMPEQYVYYYDGEWVFFQIADYTKDPKYIEYAHNCQETYRAHVFAENGKLPGHRIHPHGLYEDYKRFKDEKSKEALLLMMKGSIWGPGHPIDGSVANNESCRENAYMLMTMLLAEDLGEKMPRIEPAVKNGLTCLDQFAISKTAKTIQPFMPGLEAEALIQYAEKRKAAAEILPTLTTFADWLWDQCWVAKDSAFCYRRDDPNDPKTAPTEGCADLNLLIAPMYAWLYKKTGEVRFRERGDQAFAGGVKGAWLEKGKCFSQNYRWSFSYVKWRREGPEKDAAKTIAAKTGAAESTEVPKKEAVAAATPTAPALDPAPYRAALEACIKKNAKVKKGEKVLIQTLKQEVALAGFAESGPRILIGSNEMPLRWKDLTNEDLARIAALCCEDAESLFNAGALAVSTKQDALREKLTERLLALDPQKANELLKLK